jgi:hypothetical protein
VFVKGDMDTDGGVSVTDITRIVERILTGDNTLTAAAKAYARNQMVEQQWRVDDVVARLNEEVSIPISLTETGGSYVAWQCDVVMPVGMELTDVRVNGQLKRHTVSYAQTDENRYRVVVYSMRNATMTTHEDIMELVVRPMASMHGEEQVVSIENTRLVDNSLNAQYLPSATAKVEVEGTDVDDVYVGVAVEGGKQLTITALQEQTVSVYAADGRIVRIVNVSEGVTAVALEPGVYMACGKKVVIY